MTGRGADSILTSMFHPKGPTFLELARQGLSSTKRGYDLLAPKFDYTPFRTPDEVLAVVGKTIGSFDQGLDVCCGTGAGLWMLRPRGKRVVGLDFSPGMLEEAHRQLRMQKDEGARVELVQGNALDMPYDGEFDLVTSFGAFGHIRPKEEPRFIRGIKRALKPGGRFVFVTARMPSPLSRAWLFGRTYNAVTHVRNFVWRPKFVMFYLTFMLPKVKHLLEAEGFEVQVHDQVFPEPYARASIVVSWKR